MQPFPVVPDCQLPGLAGIYAGLWPVGHPGQFVEVGAFDGRAYSNTYGLAQIGWAGLYVEPIRSHYERCVANHSSHPAVSIVQTAAGAERQTLYPRTDGAELYTLDDHLATVLAANRTTQEPVEVYPLDTILLNQAGWLRPGFELLVIDVEGHEPAVLGGFEIGYWRPQLVIIEAHEFHDRPGMNAHAPAINAYFKLAGYTRIYADSINNIYLRS